MSMFEPPVTEPRFNLRIQPFWFGLWYVYVLRQDYPMFPQIALTRTHKRALDKAEQTVKRMARWQ